MTGPMNRMEALLSSAVAIGLVLVVLVAAVLYSLATHPDTSSSATGTGSEPSYVTVGTIVWSATVDVSAGCNATVYESPNSGFMSGAGTAITVYATVEYPDGRLPACVGSSATISQVTSLTQGFEISGGNFPLTISATSGHDPSFATLEVVVLLPNYGAYAPTLNLNATGT